MLCMFVEIKFRFYICISAIFGLSSNVPLPNPSIRTLLMLCSLSGIISKYKDILFVLFPRQKRCPDWCYSPNTALGSQPGVCAIFRSSSNVPLPNPSIPALPTLCSLSGIISKYKDILFVFLPRQKRCPD